MTASVRYIVDDVAAAIVFYERLGFQTEMHPGPGFAAMRMGDLRLLINTPGAGGAGQPGDDGLMPAPGGWNRFQLEVADLPALVKSLAAQGLRFRTGIIDGRGGRQAVVDDPSGNAVELFESSRG